MINQLLKSLTFEPNDTLTWLALADFLEEAGEVERAELTRLRINPENQKRVQKLLLSGVKPCVPTLTNSIGMELALIPAGKFLMGSPQGEVGRRVDEQQHEVEITKPFWMGVYQVTQEEYEAVMGINPSYFKGERSPVTDVNWDDAMGFCDKLSRLSGERTYRLPTEAEWEYACRAGTTTRFNLGDDKDTLYEVGWWFGNSMLKTYSVGGKKPNAWGLYDMHGNSWEWCSDWYGAYPKGKQLDPSGSVEGYCKVVRGGSCYNLENRCSSACRSKIHQSNLYDHVGFRVVSNVQIEENNDQPTTKSIVC